MATEVLGARPEGRPGTLRKLEGNPDTRLVTFHPGMSQDDIDEKVEELYRAGARPLVAGDTIYGEFVRYGEVGVEKNAYGVLKDLASGTLFRTWAPGQLAYKFRNEVTVGDIIEIKYLGKEEIEMTDDKGKTVKRNVHQFEISREELEH